MTKARDLGNLVSDAAWTSYTPSLTALTLGNGTLTAKYQQIGKTIIASIYLLWGSTTSASGQWFISLPFANSTVNDTPIGSARFLDSGTQNYVGVALVSSTRIAPTILNVAGTYPTFTTVTQTVPYTWATNDVLATVVVYEAS
jgi:hypothetical protein